MNKSIFTILLFLCLIISSCWSSYDALERLPKHQIAIDSVMIDKFSTKVSSRFKNYGEASMQKDGDIILICGVTLGHVFVNPKFGPDSLTLYTFDHQDSCTFYWNVNQTGVYELLFKSLPIPEGHYFIKHGQDISLEHFP